MGAPDANISRDIYDEKKRYRRAIVQQGVPWVDADENDATESLSTYVQRTLQLGLGDGYINDGFRIVEADGTPGGGYHRTSDNVNNFVVAGSEQGGALEGADIDDGSLGGAFLLEGLRCALFGDVEYKPDATFPAPPNEAEPESARSIFPRVTEVEETGGNTIIHDSAQKYKVDEFKGRQIHILNGTLTPIDIVSNTATSITVAGSYSSVIDVYDRYVIRLTDPIGETVVNVTQGSKLFHISGDWASRFVAGRSISIAGSTGNDGTYTVVTATYDVGDDETDVEVAEAIPSATADGTLYDSYDGATRADAVYLNVYLDQINAEEDPNLLHPLSTSTEAQIREQVIQEIYVREDIALNGDWLSEIDVVGQHYRYEDVDGNLHYVIKLAEIERIAGDDTITNAMVTNLPLAFGAAITAFNILGSAEYANYSTPGDNIPVDSVGGWPQVPAGTPPSAWYIARKVDDDAPPNPAGFYKNISGNWVWQFAVEVETASDVSYDNSTSGLSATEVQSAIDEVDANLDAQITTYGAHDHSAGDPNQVSHADLLSITEDDHHDRLHSFDDAADHNPLTGFTAVDEVVLTNASGFPVSSGIDITQVRQFDVVVDRADYATDILAGDALRAALESGSYKSVFVKTGTYEVTGAGITQSTVQYVLCEPSVVMKRPVGSSGVFALQGGSTVVGMTIDRVTGSGADGFDLNGAARVVMCTFSGDGTAGIGFQGNYGNYGTKVIDCWVGEAAIGFQQLYNLSGCIAIQCTSSAFNGCSRVSNAYVYGNGNEIAFSTCSRVSNVEVEGAEHGFINCTYLTNVTSYNATGAYDFNGCDHVTNAYSGSASGCGFEDCRHLNGCRVHSSGFEAGFYQCYYLTDCYSYNAVDYGFRECYQLSSCGADFTDNDGDTSKGTGFYLCDQLSACYAEYNDLHGFQTCYQLSACKAEGNAQSSGEAGCGFYACARMSGCQATDNNSHGYHQCARIAACQSNVNDGYGFHNAQNCVGCTDTQSSLGAYNSTSAAIADAYSGCTYTNVTGWTGSYTRRTNASNEL